MFVYSVKANTLKLVGIIGGALAVLIALIFLIPEYTPSTTAVIAQKTAEYKFDKVRSNDDRVAFLNQFGWEVEKEPTEEVTMRLPSEFDKVLTTYNELQKQIGLDLSRYQGKEVTRFTYKVTNYPGYDGDVTANVIVYKNRVVGGDVCSSDVSGFIGTFEFPDGGTGESAGESEPAGLPESAEPAESEKG